MHFGITEKQTRDCVLLYKNVYVFQPYVITISERHRRTDGQTDRKTTHCGITALCVASRHKIELSFTIIYKLYFAMQRKHTNSREKTRLKRQLQTIIMPCIKRPSCVTAQYSYRTHIALSLYSTASCVADRLAAQTTWNSLPRHVCKRMSLDI